MNEQWQELKETITEMRDNNGTGTQQEVCKFLVNLMEVLEKQMQEPSGDLIRRQAVQDYIAKYLSQYLYDDVREAVEVIDEYIGELPSVKQEPKTGHWIPVSERLPEESGEYLITIKDRTYLEISWFYPSDKKWSYRNAEIIAWMPLPQPYKAESEDKE